jgi:hypothetical protein
MINRLVDVFSSFQKRGVRYIVIGGIVFVSHGSSQGSSASPHLHVACFSDSGCPCILTREGIMAVEPNKIEEMIKQLPPELQSQVIDYVESLVQRNRLESDGGSGNNGVPSVRSFFGIWKSGDPHSCDNDRIDADLAREYESTHEEDS